MRPILPFLIGAFILAALLIASLGPEYVEAAAPSSPTQNNQQGGGNGNGIPSGGTSSHSSTASSSANFQKLFLECAVKQRMGKGSVFQTLFAYTAVGTKSALFFDLVGNVFLAQHTLMDLCQDDEDAKRPAAKLITNCQHSDKNTVINVAGGAKIELTNEKKGGEKCTGMGTTGGGGEIEFETYGCPGGSLCGGLTLALVERINHAGLADVKNAYYASDVKVAQCVEQVCGAGKKLEEVYQTSTKGVAGDGKKLKQHKLFRECAVKRRDGSIETLVKNIQLSGTQTLFFSKGEHMYIGRRVGSVRKVCEKDKSAKLHIPVSKAVVSMRNNKMWFSHRDVATKTGNNGGQQRSGVTASEMFNVSPSGGITTKAANKYCRAYTKNGAYMVFLCQRDVCGVDRLILLRKKKEEAAEKAIKNKKGKSRQPQMNNLMSMENGREEVHVDHIYMVDYSGKANVLNNVRQRCKGVLGTVDGVKEEQKPGTKPVANDDNDDANGGAQEKCNPSRKGRCRTAYIKQKKVEKEEEEGEKDGGGGVKKGNNQIRGKQAAVGNAGNAKGNNKKQNKVAKKETKKENKRAGGGGGGDDGLEHDGKSMKELFAEKEDKAKKEEGKEKKAPPPHSHLPTSTPSPAKDANAGGIAAAKQQARAATKKKSIADIATMAQQQQKLKSARENKSSPI